MKCELNNQFCPICKSDINFKKLNKDFCNCKNCLWRCDGKCEKRENFKSLNEYLEILKNMEEFDERIEEIDKIIYNDSAVLLYVSGREITFRKDVINYEVKINNNILSRSIPTNYLSMSRIEIFEKESENKKVINEKKEIAKETVINKLKEITKKYPELEIKFKEKE